MNSRHGNGKVPSAGGNVWGFALKNFYRQLSELNIGQYFRQRSNFDTLKGVNHPIVRAAATAARRLCRIDDRYAVTLFWTKIEEIDNKLQHNPR